MANNIYTALQNATAKAEKYDIKAFEVVILTSEGKVMRMCANRTAIATKLKPESEKDAEVGGIAVYRLRSLIERVERLEEEKKDLQSDIRDIFTEAKSAGFDVKIMRMIIKLRKMNVADRDEQEALVDTYKRALGM